MRRAVANCGKTMAGFSPAGSHARCRGTIFGTRHGARQFSFGARAVPVIAALKSRAATPSNAYMAQGIAFLTYDKVARRRSPPSCESLLKSGQAGHSAKLRPLKEDHTL
jgi:hypothetical protein